MRIAVCGTQVPFVSGGAEVLADGLVGALRDAGHQVDLVRLPFSWDTREAVIAGALQWRLFDFPAASGSVDAVIATRFPNYLVRHPRKVVWLMHQFRQAYELRGSDLSEIGATGEDDDLVERVRRMDRLAFEEASRVFAIADNPARRLRENNGVEAEVLHPPPKLAGRYREGDFGDYVFSVGRLDRSKRFELLIDAMAETSSSLRCRIAGTGPQREALRQRIASRGVGDRVELLGYVDDDELVDLYAGSRAVCFTPFDEDFGYVTIEAFHSGKPVITATDSGGPLELVRDGENGLVVAPEAGALARAVDALAGDEALARRLGAAGRETARPIRWGPVIERLLQ